MTHILTFYNDFQKYPPIISVIRTLLDNGDKVIMLGYCSNSTTIVDFNTLGLEFHEVIKDDVNASSVVKIMKLMSYKNKVIDFINGYQSDKVKVWIFGERNGWLLHKIFESYETILYLFETPYFKIPRRFRLLCPTLNYKKTAQLASKVVCCEYNRAMITQSYFHLDKTPIVIPNKPALSLNSIPKLSSVDSELDYLCNTYKVILYQGVFNYPERRLDELCQAIELLPDEFQLLLMGPTDFNTMMLRERYQSKKIHFVPFKKSPEHLSVTINAYIGFLSYFSDGNSIQSSLNTLYCAPNKIFEYALANLPSISNNLPAMREIYGNYKIGEVCDFTPENLANMILKIDANYNKYIGFEEFFDSVDIESLILSL